jgi:hypothetical protein
MTHPALRMLSAMLAVSGIFTTGAHVIPAQTIGSSTDVYKVNYFANNIAAAPDATVRIDNPGVTYGNLCAMVYVFDNDQQLTECCGCVETQDGLRTMSVKHDLTSNPLTGVVSNNGAIKIVAAATNGSPCDPTANVSPKANLRIWATHIGNVVGAAYPVTETESSDSPLGAAELTSLQAQCEFVNILGSGHGICTCGSEVTVPPPPPMSTPIAIFGTGFAAGGPGLAKIGTVDGNFSLISCPAGACGSKPFVTLTGQYPFPPWLPDTSSAQWVGPSSGGNEATMNAVGLYDYRETFDLTGFNLSTVVLSGFFATDNSGYIQLNGVTVGPASSTFSSSTAFSLTSGFKPGINTIDFFVTNAPGGSLNPTGLIVELSGTGQL